MNVVAGDLTAVHKLMLQDLTTCAVACLDKVALKSLETLLQSLESVFPNFTHVFLKDVAR